MVGILYLLCDPHVSLTAGASRHAYKRGGGGGGSGGGAAAAAAAAAAAVTSHCSTKVLHCESSRPRDHRGDAAVALHVLGVPGDRVLLQEGGTEEPGKTGTLAQATAAALMAAT